MSRSASYTCCAHAHPEICCHGAGAAVTPPDAAPVLVSYTSDTESYFELAWTYGGVEPLDYVEFQFAVEGMDVGDPGSWTSCGTGTTSPFTLTTAAPWSQITDIITRVMQGAFRCRAVNAGGAGAWSNIIYTAPLDVSSIVIGQAGSDYTLSWSHGGQSGSAWLSTPAYAAEYSLNAGPWIDIGHGFNAAEFDNGAGEAHGGVSGDTFQIRMRAIGIDAQTSFWTTSNILNLT